MTFIWWPLLCSLSSYLLPIWACWDDWKYASLRKGPWGPQWGLAKLDTLNVPSPSHLKATTLSDRSYKIRDTPLLRWKNAISEVNRLNRLNHEWGIIDEHYKIFILNSLFKVAVLSHFCRKMGLVLILRFFGTLFSACNCLLTSRNCLVYRLHEVVVPTVY